MLALKRMAIDKMNEVEVYDSKDLESAQDDTFIASAISPSQRVSPSHTIQLSAEAGDSPMNMFVTR